MVANVSSSGGCHIQVLCNQTTTPPLVDTVAAFPFATTATNKVRSVFSAVKGKDLSGGLSLIIRQRYSATSLPAKVGEIDLIRKIDEVALLSKFTKKDLGDSRPMWVSEIPQLARCWVRDLTCKGIEANSYGNP